MNKTTKEIKELFIKYFTTHGHTLVPSNSLVPKNDPTLLFTNAGMNQFKEVFLGQESRPYKQAVTIQRCLRAGGKHNDLENVGYTKRHHTFFEMLGNFSFGDYFKREAIKYAWEFLTGKDWLNLPPEKLWITVHQKDEEAAKIWLSELKIDKNNFSKCGNEDNFWTMGETGPCGYCSEIYYDYGSDLAGSPPGSSDTGERFIEIWNLVFMQFERDKSGKLTPLPNPSIDTGMGLERIAAVVQTTKLKAPEARGDNYHTDIFKTFIDAFIQRYLNLEGGVYNPIQAFTSSLDLTAESIQCEHLDATAKSRNNELPREQLQTYTAAKVVADHLRATLALIIDGITPLNEGRGYVLRKIIRRAIYHLWKIGIYKNNNWQPVFCESIEKNALTDSMQNSFPELQASWDHKIKTIKEIVKAEEQQFLSTIDRGLKKLEQEIAKLNGKIITGETVFYLKDTLGFPEDLTKEIAREHLLTIDQLGFDAAEEKQRQTSKAASKFKNITIKLPSISTEFKGYNYLTTNSQIIALFQISGEPTNSLASGEEGIVILDCTPFYAESGGQIGDTGIIELTKGNTVTLFEVTDTKKQGTAYLHYGFVRQGILINNQKVTADIDSDRRQAIKANHSAAHLLHKVLRNFLGNHVEQRGSSVTENYLRFDFSHFSGLTSEEITSIELAVNQKIWSNLAVKTEIMTLDEAKHSEAIALFDEKYAEKVRVISMGDFSKELCGGTHVSATSEIGIFKILAESAIAAGVRRIEACTNEPAFLHMQHLDHQQKTLAFFLKTGVNEILPKIQQILEQNKAQEKELLQLKDQAAISDSHHLLSQAIDIKGIKVLVAKLKNVDSKMMRNILDRLKPQFDQAIILLATIINNKIQLAVSISKSCTEKYSAGELAQYVATQIGGSGGGKGEMAQGGGTEIAKLETALGSVVGWVENK
jgi:alanyl-tRNA synthetase